MKNFKGIAAFLTAAAIVTTLSGCSDNGYIMEVDGMPIRTGIYISFQQTSMNNGYEKLKEILGNDLDYIDDIFTQSINEKSFSDWVKDDTKRGLKRFVGIQRQCDQFGITLSDEERAKISKQVQANWDTTQVDYSGYTFTVQDIYGYDSMGDYYTSQGIGIDSLKEISYANALNDKLFKYYYGEGGQYAVPDEDIDEYLEDNSVAYKLITMQYVDYTGFPVVGEELDAIVEMAKDYAQRYNDGEQWVDILYDYDLYKAKNDAKYAAEQAYEADPPEGVSYDEYMEEALSKATATKYDDDEMFDEIVFNENEYLSDEVMDLILEAPMDGKAAAYEGSTAVYIIVRNPVKNFPGWKTEHLDTVLSTLKGEDFDNMMDLMSQNYDIVQKDDLVNGKYSPEKLNK